MSNSKAIKQVLYIVKQMRDALLGKKIYKSFKVTNVKVTDELAQIFQLLQPEFGTLGDNVILVHSCNEGVDFICSNMARVEYKGESLIFVNSLPYRD